MYSSKLVKVSLRPLPLTSRCGTGLHSHMTGRKTIRATKAAPNTTGSNMTASFPRGDTYLLRIPAIHWLILQNHTEARPHSRPIRTAGSSARAWFAMPVSDTWKITPDFAKSPKWPLSTAYSALWNMFSAKVAHMHEKKICQPKLRCQKLAISSNANSRPPIGVPKATATPAATPAVMKSLLSLEFLKLGKIGKAQPMVVDSPWLIPAPRIAPRWIMGPSGPTGRPEATASTQLVNFTKRVLMLKTRRMRQPFRYAITSGTPEAAASGAT
mmetsp:Transcript_6519/g.19661  ORF Transcript_6519/g.19661 Transcript_6519/m.19661 type:complete len:270 (+) Transcript_6519:484-1293(+)